MSTMQSDVSVISTDEYLPEEVVGQDIPEKYLYDHGKFCFASATVNTGDEAIQLVNFLFRNPESIIEVYRNDNAYLLDVTKDRSRLADFVYMENYYSKWLLDTGRENTMDEFGMLVDFAGFIRNGFTKKYTLIIISQERYCR